MRHRPWPVFCARFAVACWAAGVVVSASAESQRIRADPTRYLELLRLYREDPRAAVVTVIGWLDKEVVASSQAFLAGATIANLQDKHLVQIIDVRSLAAAIMLHTDAAVRAAGNDSNPTAILHLRIAAALVDLLRADKTGRVTFTPGTWYLAVVRSLGSLFGWDVERAALTQDGGEALDKRIRDLADIVERERVGGGAQMLLAMGSLEEGSAHMAQQLRELAEAPADSSIHGIAQTWTPPRYSSAPAGSTIRSWMVHAEQLYREALQRDGSVAEARLRLARLLFQDGNNEDARRELDHVLLATADPRRTYLALLFRARIEEAADNTTEALRFYRKALGAWPQSQTAPIAIASLNERLGDIEAARAAILPLQDRGIDWTDPWGVYFMGESEEGSRTLDQLRRAVIEVER
jgi:hypothetical protein